MEKWDINYKDITVEMSDGMVHRGKVNIRNFQRLSDFLRNKDDQFIVIVSDEGEADDGALIINKRDIVRAREYNETTGQEMMRPEYLSLLDTMRRRRK